MTRNFSPELRIAQLEAKVGGLERQLSKLAGAFNARTLDIANAHNNLVKMLTRPSEQPKGEATTPEASA